MDEFFEWLAKTLGFEDNTDALVNQMVSTAESGGETMSLANTLLDGMLVIVGLAVFVAFAVLIVQRFVGTGRDVEDSSYTIKRIAGIACVFFTILLLARGGVELAKDFGSVDSTGGVLSSQGSGTDKVAALPYVQKDDGSRESYEDIANKN